MNSILVDTGPLVAIINPRDAEHAACGAYAADLTAPMLTAWPVITEAAWMLRANQRDVRTLFRMITVRDLQVAPLPAVSAGWFEDFFEKYEDQGPQLADASLVYLANTLKIDTVFTIDRKDFNVYRKDDGSYLTVVPD